jgi:excisionase family DNA binding protein
MIDMDEEGTNQRELLTVKQAADYLGVTSAAIYMAKHKGRLVGEKHEGHVLFTSEELDAYRQFQPDQGALISPPEPEVSSPIEKVSKRRYAVERELEEAPEGEELPTCERCGRQFIATQEYTIKKFVDKDHKPYWRPVCRDGRCDPTIQDMRLSTLERAALKREQKKSARLLQILRETRTYLDNAIKEYEQEEK